MGEWFPDQAHSKIIDEQTNKPPSLWAALQTYSESLVLKTLNLSDVCQFAHLGHWLEKHFTGLLKGVGSVVQRLETKSNQNKTKQKFSRKKTTVMHWFGAAVNNIYTCNNESTGYTLNQKWMRREDRYVGGREN